jgi:hypothetical protein
MRNLLWVLPVLAFVLNPSFACVEEPEFQYGAAEMRAAVQGDWSFTITPDGRDAVQVTVHIDQATAAPPAATARTPGAGLVRAAHACGTRTLVKGAGACTSASEMPLAVTYVSGDSSFQSATLSGRFWVGALTFLFGELTLNLGEYQIVARVNADGSVADLHLGANGLAGTVAVSRL